MFTDAYVKSCSLLTSGARIKKAFPDREREPTMHYFAVIYVETSSVLRLLSSFGRSYTATYRYPFLYTPPNKKKPYLLDETTKICAWDDTRIDWVETTVETITIGDVAEKLQLTPSEKNKDKYLIEPKFVNSFSTYNTLEKVNVPFQCLGVNLKTEENDGNKIIKDCQYKPGLTDADSLTEQMNIYAFFWQFEDMIWKTEKQRTAKAWEKIVSGQEPAKSSLRSSCTKESMTDVPSQLTVSKDVYFIMNALTARYALPITMVGERMYDSFVGEKFTCDSKCTSSILKKRTIKGEGDYPNDIIDPENFNAIFISMVSSSLGDKPLKEMLTYVNTYYRSFIPFFVTFTTTLLTDGSGIERFMKHVNYDISYSTSEFMLSEMPPATTEQILKASAGQIFLPILLLTEYNEQMFQNARTLEPVSHISVYPTSNSIEELMNLIQSDCLTTVCKEYFSMISNSKLIFHRFLWPELTTFVVTRVDFLWKLLDTQNHPDFKLYGGKGILESAREILGQEKIKKYEYIQQVYGLENTIFYTSLNAQAQINEKRRSIDYKSSLQMFDPILRTTMTDMDKLDKEGEKQYLKRALTLYFVLKHILAASAGLLSLNLQVHYSIYVIKIYTLYILPYRRGKPKDNPFSEEIFRFLQQFEIIYFSQKRSTYFPANVIEFLGASFPDYVAFERKEFAMINIATNRRLGTYDYQIQSGVDKTISALIHKSPHAKITYDQLLQIYSTGNKKIVLNGDKRVSFLFKDGWSSEDWDTWTQICTNKIDYTWEDQDEYQTYACDEFLSVNEIVGRTMSDTRKKLRQFQKRSEFVITRGLIEELEELTKNGEEELSKYSKAYRNLVLTDTIQLMSMYSPTLSSSRRISKTFKIKKKNVEFKSE